MPLKNCSTDNYICVKNVAPVIHLSGEGKGITEAQYRMKDEQGVYFYCTPTLSL